MIFESNKAIYKVVRIVLSSRINDVYVCQDMGTQSSSMYVVIRIRQHETVHNLLKVFQDCGKRIDDICVECFSLDDNFLVVFPYLSERPLNRFFSGVNYNLVECENICVHLVVSLMTSQLPFPLMYLVLKQGQLNITRNDEIYVSYQIDLSELDETVTESNCVTECAGIIMGLLKTKSSETNPMSYDLIDKKINRKSYSKFVELYKDIRIAAAPSKKRTIWARIRAFFRRNKDRIFKVILVLAIILGIFMLISFLTNLFLGDIPWLRIFVGGFKYIGTENLAQ